MPPILDPSGHLSGRGQPDTAHCPHRRDADLVVFAGSGEAKWLGRSLRCTVGRNGVTTRKVEGDGASPVGAWAVRRILFRADRLAPPSSGLPVAAIGAHDGWCDASGHPLYNRPVTLPFAASHERLWRDDAAYDVLAVLGHNDDPVATGAGSAIFLHVAAADWRGTAGCVALALDDLLDVLAGMVTGNVVDIRATCTVDGP